MLFTIGTTNFTDRPLPAPRREDALITAHRRLQAATAAQRVAYGFPGTSWAARAAEARLARAVAATNAAIADFAAEWSAAYGD